MQSAQRRASNRFDKIRDHLLDTFPNSIAGLRAKAKAARLTDDEALKSQLIRDVGVLFGDLNKDDWMKPWLHLVA